jgi:dienelactone hydrolase
MALSPPECRDAMRNAEAKLRLGGTLWAWLMIFTVLGTATGCGQTSDPGEAVSFQSGSYTDLRQVLTREAPTSIIKVAASLVFPAAGKDRYPAVILVHTLAGYQEANEGWHAAEFRKAGFATLTYDSFAARGMNAAAAGGAGPGLWGSAVADAYAALRLLANHPKIDGNRVAIVGFSFGGEVAHLTALASLRAALQSGETRFAAHVSYYPSGVYGAAPEAGAYTGAPILMLLGEKDDNLPVAKVDGYLTYAKAAGTPAPIDVKVYPGGQHAWTVSTLGPSRFYPEYGSTKKCPFILLGSRGPALLIDGRAKPLDPNVIGACLREGQGYSMGYDAEVRARSTADAMTFLQRQLMP